MDEPAPAAGASREAQTGPTGVTGTGDVIAPLSVGEGVVVVAPEEDVVALDQATGQVRWHVTQPGLVHGAPVIDGDRVYVANNNGLLRVLALATGAEERSVALPTGSAETGSPVVADGRVYLGIFLPVAGVAAHVVALDAERDDPLDRPRRRRRRVAHAGRTRSVPPGVGRADPRAANGRRDHGVGGHRGVRRVAVGRAGDRRRPPLHRRARRRLARLPLTPPPGYLVGSRSDIGGRGGWPPGMAGRVSSTA